MVEMVGEVSAGSGGAWWWAGRGEGGGSTDSRHLSGHQRHDSRAAKVTKEVDGMGGSRALRFEEKARALTWLADLSLAGLGELLLKPKRCIAPRPEP